MCGIVGIVSKLAQGFYQSDVELFKNMLVADSVRGTEGTGMFGVDKNTSDVTVLKQASNPYDLINTRHFESMMTNMERDFHIIVGHNRKATGTTIKNDNTHPFVEEHITLVHNGVIWNKDSPKDEIEVDSHIVCYNFAHKGVIETLKSTDGAFAFVWYNALTKKLHMARNDQRPLYIYNRFDRLFFASEKEMLYWLIKRETRQAVVEMKDIESVPTETLLTITPGEHFKLEKQSVRYYVTPARQFFQDSNIDDMYGDRGTYPERPRLPPPPVLRQPIDHDINGAIDAAIVLADVKIGDRVRFTSNTFNRTASKIIRLEGKCLDNKTQVKAYYKPKDDEPIEKLMYKTFIGTVKTIGYNGAILMPLVFITDAEEWVTPVDEVQTTYNNKQLKTSEWREIAESHRCRSCNKELVFELGAKCYTVKKKKYKGLPNSVVCPSCIANQMKDKKRQGEFQSMVYEAEFDLLAQDEKVKAAGGIIMGTADAA